LKNNSNDLDSESYYLKHKSNLHWRTNDDESIMVFSEYTGEAFILPPPVAACWFAFNNKISDELTKNSNQSNLQSDNIDVSPSTQKHIEKTISFFIKNNLLEPTSAEDKSTRVITKKQLSSLSFHILQSISQKEKSLFSENWKPVSVQFGLCDCSQGGRGHLRNDNCTGSTPKQFASTFP